MKIHRGLSLEDPICKDINSIKDEASMEKPKDPHSDKLDESPLLGDGK